MWNESRTLVNFKNNKMPWKLYFTTIYLRGKKEEIRKHTNICLSLQKYETKQKTKTLVTSQSLGDEVGGNIAWEQKHIFKYM